MRFNKYIQENIAEAKAEKDANDFLKSTAICNKHSVNIDEWLFSFSKLYVCDADEFNKFLEDYEAAVGLQGKLKAINIWSKHLAIITFNNTNIWFASQVSSAEPPFLE